jgi:LPS export ABC transporter protein LptC
MIRRLLLGGIMLVCVGILVFALQKQRARERAEKLPPADNVTAAKPPPAEGFKLTKFDEATNEVVAVVTGTQFTETAEKGPIDIVQPRIALLKDKKTRTVITGDSGRMQGRANDKMDEGWLKGNVVLTVTDVASGDNTVLTCREMQYQGSKSQVFIPGAVKIVSRSMEVTGSRLTANGNLGKATLEKDVRLVMKEASGGALDQLAGPGTPEAAKEAKPPQPLVVTCDGTLVFYRDMNRATFEKNVLARQGDDSVRGDGMVVEFERTVPAAAEGEKPPGGQLTMRRVVVRSDRKEAGIRRRHGTRRLQRLPLPQRPEGRLADLSHRRGRGPLCTGGAAGGPGEAARGHERRIAEGADHRPSRTCRQRLGRRRTVEHADRQTHPVRPGYADRVGSGRQGRPGDGRAGEEPCERCRDRVLPEE